MNLQHINILLEIQLDNVVLRLPRIFLIGFMVLALQARSAPFHRHTNVMQIFSPKIYSKCNTTNFLSEVVSVVPDNYL